MVLRGELGEPFGFLFEGMQMDRLAGTTVLTGNVADQDASARASRTSLGAGP
jgi:hypothetical protein